jgi:hypothetical protein
MWSSSEAELPAASVAPPLWLWLQRCPLALSFFPWVFWTWSSLSL